MTRLVVFDCDGTLVDSQYVIIESMQGAFERHGLALPTPKAIKHIVGLSLPDAISRLYGPNEEDEKPSIDILASAYRDDFTKVRASKQIHEPLYPHVIETLELLQEAGYLLGIATGKSQCGLLETLGAHGLTKYFATLQTADIAPGKPHPGMMERAMAETGAEKDDTVLIGDTVFDIEMAHNAGTRAFGVSWGYHEVDKLHAAGAHLVLNHLSELLPLLAGLRSGD